MAEASGLFRQGLAPPLTLEAALDADWLSAALGRRVVHVETVEIIRTMATKARFSVRFEGEADARHYCLKGFLDLEAPIMRGGGGTTLHEADFYAAIAPQVDVRVPECVVAIADRGFPLGVIIMRDLIIDGAHFCSALVPFSADDASASLEQLARLHAGSGLLAANDWIKPRLNQLVARPILEEAVLQDLLDGPRGEGLPGEVLSAANLHAAVAALARRDAARPAFMIHGDAHAGNIYRTADGPGLIDWQLLQRGGWALDVAYHIAAVLPVDVAEREERRLVDHYIRVAAGLGLAPPDREAAWGQYREALVYGYYLWSVTRRVQPEIITLFVGRLGAAVVRHDSFGLLAEA